MRNVDRLTGNSCKFGATVIAATSFAVFSCNDTQGGAESAPSGPTVSIVDSVRLEESDSAFVGAPTALAVDPFDQSYYIADRQGEHVMRFAPDGRLLRTYGRAGAGPGELRGVAAVAVRDNSLFTADYGNSRLNVYDRATGAFVRTSTYSGFLSSLHADSNGVWMGTIDATHGTIAARLNEAGEFVRRAFALPAAYTRIPRLQTLFAHVRFAAFSDSLLIVLAGAPNILVADTMGFVADSITVPAVKRRPYPTDVDAVFRSGSPPTWLKAFAPQLEIHRFRNGEIAVVHANLNPVELGGEKRAVNLDVFVSVISADRSRACADAEVPASHDSPPIIGFADDTLLVVEQRAMSRGPQTMIKRYLIGTESCTWIDI